MYSTPKLVRFGNFRDLTRQSDGPCPNDPQIDWLTKGYPTADILVQNGANVGDGCPARS